MVIGQSKRQLHKQQEAEALENRFIEFEQKRAEIEQRKAKLAENAKRRIELGEVVPLKVYDSGGELCECNIPGNHPSDKTVSWTNPVGGKEYICVNYGLGDVILTWRKWYCLGEGENCVRSEWKNGEPTFGDYSGMGTMSFNFGNGIYYEIKGI